MYPGILIWNLQIRRKLKVVISLLMGLSVTATIFAVGKIIDFGLVKATSKPKNCTGLEDTNIDCRPCISRQPFSRYGDVGTVNCLECRSTLASS